MKRAKRDTTVSEWNKRKNSLSAKKSAKAPAMPPISEAQLREVMKFHLTNFNDEGVTISDATIHNTVLSENDGFGSSNSKNIYQSAVHLTLIKRGHPNAVWPSDWMEQNVANVAAVLID